MKAPIAHIQFKPSLHKEVQMYTRVRVRNHPELVGTVEGIATAHTIFHYIVRLDQETYLETHGQMVKSIAVSGTDLESPDGSTHWRIEP